LSTSELGTESIPISPALEPASGTADRNRRGLTAGRVIMALMLREMTTKYGRTPGGYVWAILEPVAMIVVLSFGFSLVMRSPSLGNSFIVFYASGFLPFNQYRTLEAWLPRHCRTRVVCSVIRW
jgi:capsular polysaccharide transport system permease protein